MRKLWLAIYFWLKVNRNKVAPRKSWQILPRRTIGSGWHFALKFHYWSMVGSRHNSGLPILSLWKSAQFPSFTVSEWISIYRPVDYDMDDLFSKFRSFSRVHKLEITFVGQSIRFSMLFTFYYSTILHNFFYLNLFINVTTLMTKIESIYTNMHVLILALSSLTQKQWVDCWIGNESFALDSHQIQSVTQRDFTLILCILHMVQVTRYPAYLYFVSIRSFNILVLILILILLYFLLCTILMLAY